LLLRVALAIHQINPALPQAQARDFAAEVVSLGDRQALDPWLLVEVVRTETRWTPGLVRHEHDGSCSVGLAQINVDCDSTAPLLEPHANLRQAAKTLASLRRTCKRSCGGGLWLRGYNPGSSTYAPAILAAVKRRHANP
jgi:hypothetical protein